MFFDYLTIYQDFDFDLPLISGKSLVVFDNLTGEMITDRQEPIKYEGSYSTRLTIHISGRRIRIKGNPSRVDRLDNLFGFMSLDDCVAKYNQILVDLGLPVFTKCTKTWQMVGQDGKRALTCSDGAVITELHITTNRFVGKGNVHQYLKHLASQPYRHSQGHLHPNGCTSDWVTKLGHAPLVYASVYDKANEIQLHQLPKIKRLFGESSPQYQELLKVYNHCLQQGVVRFEQKLKSRFLRRENLQYWGLSDYSKLLPLHQNFLNIDTKLKVDNMEFEHIAERLIREGICNSMQAANTTAQYVTTWMHGKQFDLSKAHVKRHRARLRKIGIDIGKPCDLTVFSPVHVVKSSEIIVGELPIPHWYKKPSLLRLVA